ncbi:MAG: putative nitroreductase [Deltaproteobacteria bacterium]|nr:putative nitroreductase [Deltaproteobacteria bacterium]
MSFLDLARKRQSDRGFLAQPVERLQIERCLEAARLAPSACNSQPWFFVVVDEPALRTAIAAELNHFAMNRFAPTAPVLVAVVAENPTLLPRLGGMIKDKPYYLLDIGMAVEHFCLQAADEGLGSCIIGWFNEAGVKRLLGIPKGKRVPLVIALGYPADPATRPKTRREPDATRSYNDYPGTR